MARPTSTTCEVCGRPVEVAAKGRIGFMHPACRDLRNDIDRVQRSATAAIETMSYAERRAFRKQLLSLTFHFVNATFNGAKPAID